MPSSVMDVVDIVRQNPLLVSSVTTVLLLAVFAYVLSISGGQAKKKPRKHDLGEPTDGGTHFVQTEDGQLLRRSCRVRKVATGAQDYLASLTPTKKAKTPIKETPPKAVTRSAKKTEVIIKEEPIDDATPSKSTKTVKLSALASTPESAIKSPTRRRLKA